MTIKAALQRTDVRPFCRPSPTGLAKHRKKLRRRGAFQYRLGNIAARIMDASVNATPAANIDRPNLAPAPRHDSGGISLVSPRAAAALMRTKCQPKVATPARATARPPKLKAFCSTQAAERNMIFYQSDGQEAAIPAATARAAAMSYDCGGVALMRRSRPNEAMLVIYRWSEFGVPRY